MQSESMIQALKEMLRARDITYGQVAHDMRISEATVKRLFSRGGFSLDRFMGICTQYEIPVDRLAALAQGRVGDEPFEYTEKQEQFFVEYPHTLRFFDQLLRTGSALRTLNVLGISKVEAHSHLRALDHLGLIELRENFKVRFPLGRSVKWRKNGPLRALLFKKAKAEFLESEFEGLTDFLQFRLLDLSEANLQRLCLRLSRLIRETQEDAQVDQILGRGGKRVGLLVASRPWNLPVLQ